MMMQFLFVKEGKNRYAIYLTYCSLRRKPKFFCSKVKVKKKNEQREVTGSKRVKYVMTKLYQNKKKTLKKQSLKHSTVIMI